jgi:S1-C subfamily serine protease
MLRNLSTRLGPALTALAGALVALVLTFAFLQLNPPGGRYDDADIQRLADERIEQITPTPPLEPELYALVQPSVVTVFREPPNAQGRFSGGLGSGVVIDEFGNILTAYHVIAGKTEVTVGFADGSVRTATVDVEEPDRDLAVLHVDGLPAGVTPATIGGGVRTGDKVMAIGSPYGLEGTFTAGVVSNTGRNFVVDQTGAVLTDMIQFDAAVNPGSSGGPLIDMGGRVVGIVTGIRTTGPEGGFIGMGFAVPIETAGGALPAID